MYRGIISLKAGEQISFLSDNEQGIISEIIFKNREKISEQMAQKIRHESELELGLNKKQIAEIIEGKSDKEVIYINFSKAELDKYFEGIKDKNELKKFILKKIQQN